MSDSLIQSTYCVLPSCPLQNGPKNDNHEDSIKKYATYCREHGYVPNDALLDFQQTYKKRNPSWWYVNEPFIYAMINNAVRTLALDFLIRMSFFIQDLSSEIRSMHEKQRSDKQQKLRFFYRGQAMLQTDFDQLRQAKDGLGTFHTFLLATENRDSAVVLAQNARPDPYCVGSLFEIIIDSAIISSPFARIVRETVGTGSQNKILFAMNAVFRIDHVQKIDNNQHLWEVRIRLVADSDPRLDAVAQSMVSVSKAFTEWNQLGEWLIGRNRYYEAEKLYRMLLERTLDEEKKVNIYSRLGMVTQEQGRYDDAIKFYEEAFEIKENISSSDQYELGKLSKSIGLVYELVGNYSKAIQLLEKSLTLLSSQSPPDHLELADTHEIIGMFYSNGHDFQKPLSSFNAAVEQYRSYSILRDTDLIRLYSRIGLVHHKLGDSSIALNFLHRAMATCEK